MILIYCYILYILFSYRDFFTTAFSYSKAGLKIFGRVVLYPRSSHSGISLSISTSFIRGQQCFDTMLYKLPYPITFQVSVVMLISISNKT